MASQRFTVPRPGPEAPHCASLTIRRSRFLAQSCRCESREAARDFVACIRQMRPDATHNCWAFAAGPPGDTSRIGCSDDGEPHGTAGRPMLNVLLHSGIGQICVVVSRWFGGIKLGCGGLARAYQDSVQANLASLPVCDAVPRALLRLRLDYASLIAVQRGLQNFEAHLLSEEYAEQATLLLSVPEEQSEALAAFAASVSGGAAVLTPEPDSQEGGESAQVG